MFQVVSLEGELKEKAALEAKVTATSEELDGKVKELAEIKETLEKVRTGPLLTLPIRRQIFLETF